MCVLVLVQVCACKCGAQRSKSAVIPQELCTLIFEIGPFFFLTWNSLSKQVGPRFLKIHCPTSPVLAPTLTSVCRCGEDSQTQVFMLSQHEALF